MRFCGAYKRFVCKPTTSHWSQNSRNRIPVTFPMIHQDISLKHTRHIPFIAWKWRPRILRKSLPMKGFVICHLLKAYKIFSIIYGKYMVIWYGQELPWYKLRVQHCVDCPSKPYISRSASQSSHVTVRQDTHRHHHQSSVGHSVLIWIFQLWYGTTTTTARKHSFSPCNPSTTQ